MAEQWPLDVPECYLLSGYLEEQQPVVIRSPVDAGPQKVRRRYTQPITGIVTGLAVDKDELEAFWLWFNVTLQGGVKTFDMTNPVTSEVDEARFLQPPRMTPITDDKFSLELIVEVF